MKNHPFSQGVSMIEVYHNSDFLDFGLRLLSGEKIEKIPEDIIAKVADVDTDSLDIAYCLTNNIEESWTKNKQVISTFSTLRSTSMGDVLVKDGIAYMVVDTGFKNITITDSTGVIV